MSHVGGAEHANEYESVGAEDRRCTLRTDDGTEGLGDVNGKACVRICVGSIEVTHGHGPGGVEHTSDAGEAERGQARQALETA